jgi:hypothetical protein
MIRFSGISRVGKSELSICAPWHFGVAASHSGAAERVQNEISAALRGVPAGPLASAHGAARVLDSSERDVWAKRGMQLREYMRISAENRFLQQELVSKSKKTVFDFL